MELEKIYATESGKLIRRHLELMISKLDTVKDINNNVTVDEIGKIVLSKIIAIEWLNDMLKLTEPKEELKIKSNKKKYGL